MRHDLVSLPMGGAGPLSTSRSKGFTGLPESGLNHGWKAQFQSLHNTKEEEQTRAGTAQRWMV
ncbi:MAG: hypothetical protein ACETVV_03190 [Nitrososphaeria archaeon]